MDVLVIESVRDRFSAPIQTEPVATSHTPPTSSCSTRIGSVLHGSRGRVVALTNNQPISAKVTERVELYLYTPSGFTWPATGWDLPNSPLLPVGSREFVSRHITHQGSCSSRKTESCQAVNCTVLGQRWMMAEAINWRIRSIMPPNGVLHN